MEGELNHLKDQGKNQMSTFELTKTGLKCVILNTQGTYLTRKLKLNFGDLNLLKEHDIP